MKTNYPSRYRLTIWGWPTSYKNYSLFMPIWDYLFNTVEQDTAKIFNLSIEGMGLKSTAPLPRLHDNRTPSSEQMQNQHSLFWSMFIKILVLITKIQSFFGPHHFKRASITYAFLLHRIESWNCISNKIMYRYLQSDRDLHLAEKHRLKIRGSMAASIEKWNLFRSIEILDCYAVKSGDLNLRGYTVSIRNCFEDFIIAGTEKNRLASRVYVAFVVRARMLYAILFCQNVLKAKLIGLGGLTKDQSLTYGGRWFVETIGKHLTSIITNGDHLTVGCMIAQLEKLEDSGTLQGRNALITGVTSKVGKPLAVWLAKRGWKVDSVTASEERFNDLLSEIDPANRTRLTRASTVKDIEGKNFDLCIVLKSIPFGKDLINEVNRLSKKGKTVLLNGAVPDPCDVVSLQSANFRHLDGGFLQFDRNIIDMNFLGWQPMSIQSQQNYALGYTCWGETVLLAMLMAQGECIAHHIGPIDLERAKNFWAKGQEILKFDISPWTSHMVPVIWRADSADRCDKNRIFEVIPRNEAS